MSKNRIAILLMVLPLVLSASRMNRRPYDPPPPVIRDVSGGATIQRARIDKVIDSTAVLGFQEAVDSLDNYCLAYELAFLAAKRPASTNSHAMSQVLSDRRTCKIFEHINKLSREQASVAAEQVFDAKFAAFVSEWNSFAETLRNEETGPKHHAASVGLFLCSYFCSPETLDQKIETWSNFVNDKKFDAIPGVFALQGSRFIDPLFHLNLLVISGDRAGAWTVPLNASLQALTLKVTRASYPRLQVSELQLFKWNAETLDTDFTHITRGVPASEDYVLITLPGFADPDSKDFIRHKRVFDEAIQLIRAWQRNQ